MRTGIGMALLGLALLVVSGCETAYKDARERAWIGGEFGPLRSYYHWRNRMLWVEREFGLRERWRFYGRAMLPQIHRRLRSARYSCRWFDRRRLCPAAAGHRADPCEYLPGDPGLAAEATR